MSDKAELTTVRVTISGRVQGVWYRGWTVETAQRLGLRGWVRNRANGDVEAVFCGLAEIVNDMVAACWQGPSAAVVRDVVIEPQATALPADEHRFHQLPTL